MCGDDFIRPDSVDQLGHPPKRIDLLTTIDGVRFDADAEALERHR